MPAGAAMPRIDPSTISRPTSFSVGTLAAGSQRVAPIWMIGRSTPWRHSFMPSAMFMTASGMARDSTFCFTCADPAKGMCRNCVLVARWIASTARWSSDPMPVVP